MIPPSSDRSAPPTAPHLAPPSGLPDPSKGAPVRWLYPGAVVAMILLASGRGQVAGPDIINFDKLVHFVVFGLIATLALRALSGSPFRRAWLAVVLVSLFGASDEFRQSFTPGRSMSFADWIADTAGAIAAVSVYTLWPLYRRVLETPLHVRWLRRRSSPLAPAVMPLPENHPVV